MWWQRRRPIVWPASTPKATGRDRAQTARQPVARRTATIRQILSGVAKTYKQQANIDVVIINGPVDVLVEKDLKDPMFPQEKETFLAIHDATPPKFFSADAVIFLHVEHKGVGWRRSSRPCRTTSC